MSTGAPAPGERAAELQALYAAVQAQPWAHDFFALLRRVEALHPTLPRWGTAARPQQEPLRLGEAPELDFAPAALSRFTPRDGGVPRLEVRFFGLLGPQGPMPLHLTEHVRERQHNHGDPTIARFLDLFHHRMLALLYRAWAQSQPVVQRDRPQDDRFAAWLGATFGLGTATRGRDHLPDAAKLHHAGLLGTRSRHPEGLARLLSHHFRVPVAVVGHVPQWLALERDDRARLGLARNRAQRAGARAPQLGRSATAGSKVYDRQYKFRLVFGPLTTAQYEAFLPGGSAWRPMRDAVHLYVGHDLLWDVELVLRATDVPEPRLDRRVRLGLNGWLGRPTGRDRRDLHLRPETAAPRARPGALHG